MAKPYSDVDRMQVMDSIQMVIKVRPASSLGLATIDALRPVLFPEIILRPDRDP